LRFRFIFYGGDLNIDLFNVSLNFFRGYIFDCISLNLVFEIGLEIFDFFLVKEVMVSTFPAFLNGIRFALLVGTGVIFAAFTVIVFSVKYSGACS